jgi:hypothetical protein
MGAASAAQPGLLSGAARVDRAAAKRVRFQCRVHLRLARAIDVVFRGHVHKRGVVELCGAALPAAVQQQVLLEVS